MGGQSVTVLQANKEFNVKGDGVEHNTLELMALRDHIRAGPDTTWLVEFEPGHYLYNDERWLNFGDRTVILEFNGANVECAARPFLPLGAGPITWIAEYPATPNPANATSPPGYLFETAQVNDREARLKEPLVGDFVPGDKVLVGGYSQQLTADGKESSSWPPNFRYFEWKTVAAVVGDFALRFVDPFRYTYDAGWPDYRHGFNGLSYGTPRIWRGRLDDGRHINRSLTIRNAKFIAGRHRAPGTETPLSGRGWHIRFENCSTGENTLCWPSECYLNEYLDCQFGGRQVELDKIVERFRMERCDIYGEVGGGGASVLDVAFRDCNFYGFVRGLTPRRSWRFEGACHFYNGLFLSRGLTNTPFALTSAASAM